MPQTSTGVVSHSSSLHFHTNNEVQALGRTLLQWYRCNARHLPFRSLYRYGAQYNGQPLVLASTEDSHDNDGSQHCSPRNVLLGHTLTDWVYRVYISEVMAQQTQAARVATQFTQWMERFPTIHHVAAAPIAQLQEAFQGLGYYRRLEHIHATAKRIVADYHGHFPRTKDALLQLPGVGPYISDAILTFGFGFDSPCLDTNIYRMVGRLIGVTNVSGVHVHVDSDGGNPVSSSASSLSFSPTSAPPLTLGIPDDIDTMAELLASVSDAVDISSPSTFPLRHRAMTRMVSLFVTRLQYTVRECLHAQLYPDTAGGDDAGGGAANMDDTPHPTAATEDDDSPALPWRSIAHSTEFSPHYTSAELIQAVMDLASDVCVPLQPKCHLCPVSMFCRSAALRCGGGAGGNAAPDGGAPDGQSATPPSAAEQTSVNHINWNHPTVSDVLPDIEDLAQYEKTLQQFERSTTTAPHSTARKPSRRRQRIPATEDHQHPVSVDDDDDDDDIVEVTPNHTKKRLRQQQQPCPPTIDDDIADGLERQSSTAVTTPEGGTLDVPLAHYHHRLHQTRVEFLHAYTTTLQPQLTQHHVCRLCSPCLTVTRNRSSAHHHSPSIPPRVSLPPALFGVSAKEYIHILRYTHPKHDNFGTTRQETLETMLDTFRLGHGSSNSNATSSVAQPPPYSLEQAYHDHSDNHTITPTTHVDASRMLVGKLCDRLKWVRPTRSSRQTKQQGEEDTLPQDAAVDAPVSVVASASTPSPRGWTAGDDDAHLYESIPPHADHATYHCLAGVVLRYVPVAQPPPLQSAPLSTSTLIPPITTSGEVLLRRHVYPVSSSVLRGTNGTPAMLKQLTYKRLYGQGPLQGQFEFPVVYVEAGTTEEGVHPASVMPVFALDGLPPVSTRKRHAARQGAAASNNTVQQLPSAILPRVCSACPASLRARLEQLTTRYQLNVKQLLSTTNTTTPCCQDRRFFTGEDKDNHPDALPPICQDLTLVVPVCGEEGLSHTMFILQCAHQTQFYDLTRGLVVPMDSLPDGHVTQGLSLGDEEEEEPAPPAVVSLAPAVHRSVTKHQGVLTSVYHPLVTATPLPGGDDAIGTAISRALHNSPAATPAIASAIQQALPSGTGTRWYTFFQRLQVVPMQWYAHRLRGEGAGAVTTATAAATSLDSPSLHTFFKWITLLAETDAYCAVWAPVDLVLSASPSSSSSSLSLSSPSANSDLPAPTVTPAISPSAAYPLVHLDPNTRLYLTTTSTARKIMLHLQAARTRVLPPPL